MFTSRQTERPPGSQTRVYKMTAMTKREKNEVRIAAIGQLRALYKPGDSVHMVTSDKAVTVLLPDPTRASRIQNVSHLVADACGFPRMPYETSVRLSKNGCPASRTFWLAYCLGRALFPEGFTVTPDTMHRNGVENGSHDSDGGYALAAWVLN